MVDGLVVSTMHHVLASDVFLMGMIVSAAVFGSALSRPVTPLFFSRALLKTSVGFLPRLALINLLPSTRWRQSVVISSSIKEA